MIVTPQGIVLIIFGLFVCFTGYSMFRSMLPLLGFILGGFVAITFAPVLFKQSDPSLLFMVIAFVIGGALLALISAPAYVVGVFLSGALLGGLVGLILGSYLQMSNGTVSMRALTTLANMPFPPPVDSTFQLVIMVVFALITGGFAVMFQKFMVTASTATVGAAAMIAGYNASALEMMRGNPSRAVWILLAWLVLTMLGMFVQYRLRDES